MGKTYKDCGFKKDWRNKGFKKKKIKPHKGQRPIRDEDSKTRHEEEY